nr:flagellar protein FlaG [Bacteroidales bacterium]
MNILSLVEKVNRGSGSSSIEEKSKTEPRVIEGNFRGNKEPEAKEITKAVDSLNRSVIDHLPKVSFSYNEKTKSVIVK